MVFLTQEHRGGHSSGCLEEPRQPQLPGHRTSEEVADGGRVPGKAGQWSSCQSPGADQLSGSVGADLTLSWEQFLVAAARVTKLTAQRTYAGLLRAVNIAYVSFDLKGRETEVSHFSNVLNSQG